MAKVSALPVATNDFVKSNGSAREDHLMICTGPSMTRQEFAEDCDINVLMERYKISGTLPIVDAVPSYVDWNLVPDDLMTAMRQMHDAEAAFMTLPANVRKEFDNNAVEFVRFASEPGNLDQMREWGLAPPAEPPNAVKEVPVAPEPPGPPAKPASS